MFLKHLRTYVLKQSKPATSFLLAEEPQQASESVNVSYRKYC